MSNKAVEASDITLRDMRSSDLKAIVHIEQIAQVSPWARLSFEESLTKNYLCRVLELHDEPCAYHICSMVLDELHILNVVCSPHRQGHGLGHVLMSDIIDQAEQQSLAKLFLEVRASNSVAQSLYRKWGFKQIAIRKQYYRPNNPNGAREDALVYLRSIFG